MSRESKRRLEVIIVGITVGIIGSFVSLRFPSPWWCLLVGVFTGILAAFFLPEPHIGKLG